MLSYSAPPPQLLTLTIAFYKDLRECVKSFDSCRMEIYITKIINIILFHMWTRVIVTSTDLRLNALQPTPPRDNLAVSKAVFIADVIFETALFMCSCGA